MIKRTLHFSNPAYLSTSKEQLIVKFPTKAEKNPISIPIEDIGVVILEHAQITITNGLLDKFTTHNVALVNCNQKHMPVGLLMSLEGHTEQSERFKHQIKSSQPLKKNLWQQTIIAKIKNQAYLLMEQGIVSDKMLYWAQKVTSGDAKNHEARAAAYYWSRLFYDADFKRDQYGSPPNNLLNYGYAILRGIIARSLIGSGLLPTLGIHHRNKYNAYCLADDIMEPYRPFVDRIVLEVINSSNDIYYLTPTIKKELLKLAGIDILINGKKSPLLVGVSRTTNSLYECFSGVSRKIIYPTL